MPEPVEPDPGHGDDKAPDRADWLVGPEEGLAAEDQRNRETPRITPLLRRPGGEPAPAAPAPAAGPNADPQQEDLFGPPAGPGPPAGSGATPPPPGRGRVGAVQADDARSDLQPGLMSWEPGANSVPAMRREGPPPRPAATPSEPEREFPMDDAEERARAAADAAVAAAAAAEAAHRPHEVVAPREFEIRAVTLPVWMRIGDQLRTDRRLQLGALAAALAILLVAAWPRGEHTLSLATLNAHAPQYDGQVVRVSGRVGEVFQVGAGYAFYIHQGQDTLVVFSRVRAPETNQHLVLNGTVSTGYLDGVSRTALFESDSDK